MSALRQSAFADATGDVWLVLLTISHPDLADDIRVVNNTEQITSNGQVFLSFPFEINLPDEKDDAPSRAKLTIDNVSREIGQTIREITTPPQITIEVIRAEDPEFIEVSWPNFWLRNVSFNANQVRGDLVLEDFTDEPYPAGTFVPSAFGGLF